MSKPTFCRARMTFRVGVLFPCESLRIREVSPEVPKQIRF